MQASAGDTREDTATSGGPHRAKTMLALIAFAELLGMSLWFAGSAVAAQLTARWDLSPSQVGGLATAVQLGFVLGTAISALLNLADVVPAKRLFAVSAICGAAANLLLLASPSYEIALASRVLTGAFLAGVYPPAMKMAATWFKTRRGLAVAIVVGALTVGKASPYIWQAFEAMPLQVPIIAASLSSLLAACVILLRYEDGPFAFPSRPFSWGLIGEVARVPKWRRALGGYLGHMAELYSYWTWIPAFLAASAAAHQSSRIASNAAASSASAAAPPSWVAILSFATIAIGGLGCIWGGVMGDSLGRARIASRAMLLSGTIALLIGFAFGRSPWLVGALALAWGFFVIADSAQFSVLAAEAVPPHAVGTALTVQTCFGFLLTTITIQIIPPLVERVGWDGAFMVLAIGPALGVWALRPLVAAEKARLSSTLPNT
jgi:sugar phosphate permease